IAEVVVEPLLHPVAYARFERPAAVGDDGAHVIVGTGRRRRAVFERGHHHRLIAARGAGLGLSSAGAGALHERFTPPGRHRALRLGPVRALGEIAGYVRGETVARLRVPPWRTKDVSNPLTVGRGPSPRGGASCSSCRRLGAPLALNLAMETSLH